MMISVSFVRADSNVLAPNQFWGLGKVMDSGDTLNFQITSSKSINVYIMNSAQFSQYQNSPQDTASEYYKGWVGVLSLTDSFVALDSDTYYVLMINPSDTQSASVTVYASVEPAKSIAIYSPINTDTFENGYNEIQWTTTGSISDIRIELYNMDSFLEVIIASTYNDGTYSWYLSSDDIYSGNDYQVRLSDYHNNSIDIFSDYFTITITITPTDNTPFAIPGYQFLVLFLSSFAVIGVIILKKFKK